jgi:hypothetical protein
LPSEQYTVLGTGAVAAGKNLLGQVKDSYITLRGLIRKTTLEIIGSGPDPRDPRRYSISLGSMDLSVMVDTALQSFPYTEPSTGITEKSVSRSREGSSSSEAENGTPFHLLYIGCKKLLALTKTGPRYTGDRSHVWLILGKSPWDNSISANVYQNLYLLILLIIALAYYLLYILKP